MHGHHIAPMNANQLSLYSALAAEKAANAQRAAEVRRKLLGQPVLLEEDEFRVSGGNEGAPDQHSRRQHAKAAAVEGEESGEPISMWA
ncbi:hypothetical protein SAMN05421770_103333 [Granulicella rosea]|uniref:Uncharacterized protein n=1 Tax=Granulicella rosea TaxID=474952 RepID=A0A239IY21_9BACT|nr:hypothetical protein [Granulicella rosea]SNS98282.1 hypothetical protein SAMN05421770_103333 [Granulicella rosea]